MGRKASTINLSEDERLYLETQMRARTIQAQTVIRARILLLKAEGISVDHIADKVGMNRKSVMLCINKYLEGGVENALFDAPGRGRNAEITDDEKAWIINIACQKYGRVLFLQNILINLPKKQVIQGCQQSVSQRSAQYWKKRILSLTK